MGILNFIQRKYEWSWALGKSPESSRLLQLNCASMDMRCTSKTNSAVMATAPRG